VLTWERGRGAPGDHIVAQGFEALGNSRFRYWSRWDTGVEVWEDRISSGFYDVNSWWTSSYQSCGAGRGRVPIHVKMVSTADLLSRRTVGPDGSTAT
jgi:hypothetical protein